MKARYVSVLLATIVIAGCKPDEPQPVDIIVNGNMESGGSSPTGWTPLLSYPSISPDEFQLEWTSKASSSPDKALRISTAVAVSADFAYWAQQKCNDIPRRKTLRLKAKIKGNLTGPGVSIALRCDDTSQSNGNGLQFVTTQQNTAITGTFDWTEYSVEIGKVERAVNCIWVFLIYNQNTTGEVFFDDVSLTYH